MITVFPAFMVPLFLWGGRRQQWVFSKIRPKQFFNILTFHKKKKRLKRESDALCCLYEQGMINGFYHISG